MLLTHRLSLIALIVTTTACSSDPEASSSHCAGESGRLVVTADWLNRSLTLLSHARLVAGCAAEEAIVDRIDLSAYAPGPLQVEIAPDGTTALVSLTAGFFEGEGGTLVGSPEVAEGGGLLVVDLGGREVVREIETQHVPMGIAISPDGSRAFTANFGRADAPGGSMSVIDLDQGEELQTVMVGALPEQVSLSEDGAIGVINLAGDDAMRVFSSDDPAGTMSPPVATGSDPSDVVIVGDRAVVTNSVGFSFSVFDIAEPTVPTLLETVQLPAKVPYGVSHVPGTETVLVTGFLGTTTLYPVDLGSSPSQLGETYELDGAAFPIGVAVDAEGAHAFVAHATDHVLSVVDLETGRSHALTWLTQPGPTYVAVQP